MYEYLFGEALCSEKRGKRFSLTVYQGVSVNYNSTENSILSKKKKNSNEYVVSFAK